MSKQYYTKKFSYFLFISLILLSSTLLANNPVSFINSQHIQEKTNTINKLISRNDNNIKNVQIKSASNPFDNKTHRFLFLYSNPITIDDNVTLFNLFTSLGGIIKEEPWNHINGFSGTINNSQEYLGSFIASFPPVDYFEDPIAEIQMNSIQDQINYYPEIYNMNNFSIKGTSNASIAIIDTGVDISHPFFNNSYQDENFSKKIIGWTDGISNFSQPYDDNGHGTAMSAIIGGSNNVSAMSNHSNNEFYLTKTASINHEEYFYPHYLSEGWYDIKLGSFEMDENALDILNITANLTIFSPMLEYRLRLYRNGNIINETSSIPLELTWDTSGFFDTSKKPGVYDIVFSYHKNLEQNPQFSIQIQALFTPKEYPSDTSEYSGLAPETHISMIKELNSSGKGYISDIISGLEHVITKIQSKHIITLLLSIATIEIPSSLENPFKQLIDEIIKKGCMVIFAAGNFGISNKLNAMALNDKALVIGATNDQDQLTYYSSQADDNKNNRMPDLLAPGGSLLVNHQMVITADSNMGDNNNQTKDLIKNDLSGFTGTSISAAVVAGIYNLIVDYLGGWNYWNSGINATLEALKIKNYLLMTASETNQAREDNPFTPYDESTNSPIVNRGQKDRFEGYGRMNPEAVFNMLQNSIDLNHNYQIELTASNSDPFSQHVFALNVSLEKDQIYLFNLTNDEGIFSNFDIDMYLYNKDCSFSGEPILEASSTQAGSSDEIIYFTNLNASDTFYLVIKALSGSGSCSLQVTKVNLTNAPALNNPKVNIDSELNYNDTLDTYRFEVNYTQDDNVPATLIDIIFPSLSKNYSLIQSVEGDTNYENGAIYYVEVKFQNPGNYSYYYFARTGNLSIYYLKNNSQSLIINPIHHFVGNNFTTVHNSDINLWDFDQDSKNIYLNNKMNEYRIGWQKISIPQLYENRYLRTQEDNWSAWYFGIANPNNLYSSPILIDQTPLYTYENISGTYDLYSPIIFLESNNNESFSPILSLGMRLSINEGDSLTLEINPNRSNWKLLDSWTYNQFDWSMLHYNLSEYKGNYVQIRLRIVASSNKWIYKKGVLLDHFSVSMKNNSNSHEPMLSAAFSPENQEIPLYQSTNGTDFENIQFTIGYWDEDGNLPEIILLEINHQNYTLFNQQGIWETGSFTNSSENEIIYSAFLSCVDFSNTTFRFHAFDSKFSVSTNWFELKDLQKASSQQFPIDNPIEEKTALIGGYPSNQSFSSWNDQIAGWHQIKNLNNSYQPKEWYSGAGDYLGYGHNYKSSLYSPVLNINASHEVYLFLTHRLRFDSDGNDGNDFAEILISDNYGKSWNSLMKFNEETVGLDFKSIAIDITNYNFKNVILQFYFSTDNSGDPIQYTGWRIREISININISKDYIKPNLILDGFSDRDTISGIFNFTVFIQDDSPIDFSRTEMWIDNHRIDVMINRNNTISVLIDTLKYDNGYPLEIILVVYDIEGNREFEKITLFVYNPPSPLSIILYSFTAVFGAIVLGKFVYSQIKIQKLKKEGKYVRKPNFFERRQQVKFEAEQIREEARLILNNLDKEWEKAQPIKLYCKKCKRLYLGEEFELFCPHCQAATLYVAKYCPACKIWNYFDDDNPNSKCKKCDLILLKDFDKAKEFVITSQSEGIFEDIHEPRVEERET
ncbi:MAG: S8 family serine peptidase [Candidatus Lokiarchaeota archaeon]|nr:S8 family serine peptidase [Candidatus Harpocratesius repetitus]